jgi:hypothetical protein
VGGGVHGLGSIASPYAWALEEDEAISQMKTEELDRLVAAGKIRAIDRERVSFIVRTAGDLANLFPATGSAAG